MKKITTLLFLALVSLVMQGNAKAQTREVRADIPFDFTAGRSSMPAGSYSITSDNNITVVIHNGRQSASILRSAPVEEDTSKGGRLIFKKYGDQYFLRQIICPSVPLNVEFAASKAEEKVRLQRAALRPDSQELVALNQ